MDRTLGGQGWRVITSTFVHAGFLRLAAKMAGLFFWAPLVERLYGNGMFLLLDLFSEAAGSLAGLVLHPQVVSVGASGALPGLVGALGIRLLSHRGSIHNAVSGRIHVASHVGGPAGGVLPGAIVSRLTGGVTVAAVCVVCPNGRLMSRRIVHATPESSTSDGVVSITSWFAGGALRIESLQDSLLAGPLASDLQREKAARRLQRECLEAWQDALPRLNTAALRGGGLDLPRSQDLRRAPAGRSPSLDPTIAEPGGIGPA